MFEHLITSWHLAFWNVKISLSQEWKELSKWNKKHSVLFYKSYLLEIKNKKQASKDLADTTFKLANLVGRALVQISTTLYRNENR